MKVTCWLLFVAALLAACGGPPASATVAPLATPLPAMEGSQASSALKVVLVPSELVLGPNRFAVGLFDAAGHMILNAAVHFRYFDMSSGQSSAAESEADAVRLQTPDGSSAIYAHERNFDRAGDWGIEVQARLSDGTMAVERVGFQVLAVSSTITPGKKAPIYPTPTAADVNGDLTRLTSATAPNAAFYRISLDKAIASGKPTVLLFATPAFCESRMCGPAYEVLSLVQKTHPEAANFIHVEVYGGLPDPAATGWQLAPAMQAFGLSSEPWVFFIDGKGTVVYRIEGLVTANEIERHLKLLTGT